MQAMPKLTVQSEADLVTASKMVTPIASNKQDELVIESRNDNQLISVESDEHLPFIASSQSQQGLILEE